MLWLAIAALLLLWGGVQIDRHFFYSKPAPRQISLDSPQLIVANLPFADVPRALEWSPYGKYIALGGSVGSLKAPLQIRQGIVIVSVDSRRIVARIPTSWFAAQQFKWSKDGRLWIVAGDGWDVYAAPFGAKTHIVGNFPQFKNSDERDSFEHSLTFAPNSQTAALLPYKDDLSDELKIEIWKQGQPFYNVQLKPHTEVRSLGTPLFSPDGSFLALTVSGWVASEVSGAEELWLLDLKTRRLRLLHEGKAEFGWDNDVQSLTPAWSDDGKSIVFGDGNFGIEKINVATGGSKVVLEREWAGNDVKLSASGKWLGFNWTKFRNDTHYADRMAVASRDGDKWSLAPQGDWPWRMDAWNWHPSQDVLAWAARKSESGNAPCDLYLWRIREK